MQDNLIEYNSLIDDNPDIQRRVAKGKTEGAQVVLTTLVAARFPHLKEIAQQRITNIENIEILKLLTRQFATATDEITALWVLNSIATCKF